MVRLAAALLVATPLYTGDVADASKPSPALRTAAEQLVGSWRLVSYETRTRSGEVSAIYGPSPVGRLMYDQDGRMSVQLMDSRRRPFASNDRLIHTPEELKQAFDGYLGYFGMYTVDEAANTVTHHITGASFPNFVGTDQKRFFVLSGHRLELKTPPMLRGGMEVTFHLVWEREAENKLTQPTSAARGIDTRR